MVREAGARIHEVLSFGAGLDQATCSYSQLIGPLLEKYGDGVRAFLVDFLDPHDADVRSYVLRRLNAHFLREASSLETGVLKAIASAEKKSTSQRVRILLDTNFLFSILSLHDNPSNEVAQDLIRLTTQAKPNIRVELYVLPITVEETRRVLREVMARLSGMVLTKNIAAAAVQLSSSGLFNRYMQTAGEFQEGVLTAEAFFGPYESNLVTILRERGVELYNEDLRAAHGSGGH